MSERTKNQGMVRLLEALAREGDPARSTERGALAAILETVSRMEARQADFLNRCDVLLSQSASKRGFHCASCDAEISASQEVVSRLRAPGAYPACKDCITRGLSLRSAKEGL